MWRVKDGKIGSPAVLRTFSQSKLADLLASDRSVAMVNGEGSWWILIGGEGELLCSAQASNTSISLLTLDLESLG